MALVRLVKAQVLVVILVLAAPELAQGRLQNLFAGMPMEAGMMWDGNMQFQLKATTKLQCKLSQKVFNESVYRIKHHLAQTNQNVKSYS